MPQPKQETRKVKAIVEDVIKLAIIEMDPNYDMVSLKMESIMNKLSRNSNVAPYFSRDVIHPNVSKTLKKEKERITRMNDVKNSNFTALSIDEFKVFYTVAEILNLNAELLRSPYRQTDYTDARKMIAYIFTKYFHYNPLKVGIIMCKDRTTVLHGISRHKELMEIDRIYSNNFFKVMTSLKESMPQYFNPNISEKDEYIQTLIKYSKLSSSGRKNKVSQGKRRSKTKTIKTINLK